VTAAEHATPRLHILQSIWGMDRLRDAPREWTMAERLQRIHAAGFDGISAHFHDAATVATWIDQAQDMGMVIEGCAYPATVEDLRPALALAARHQIHHLVVQGDVRPYDAQAAVPILEGWLQLGREHGVQVLLETHRNTITNDLWVTRQMLDLVPDLALLADLSHYICGQEMTLPISARHDALIGHILAHTHAFHGRVATAEQVQVEIGFEVYRPWVEQCGRWWRQGFGHWLGRAEPHHSLTFTCELGPAPYAICDPDGRDRTDRWQDAQQMRDLVRTWWQQALADHHADHPRPQATVPTTTSTGDIHEQDPARHPAHHGAAGTAGGTGPEDRCHDDRFQ
jgi:hypothetical protein